VSRPGEFQIRDASGAPVQLRKAELTSSGFTIAGSGWELVGQGALNSSSQQVVPGQRITVNGEGLQRLTTTGIYILSQPTWVGAGIVGYDNKFTSSFLMPKLPAGNHTLQINMVRQGQLPISIAIGFTLSGDSGSGSKIPATADSTTPSGAMAKLIYFPRNSSVLSNASKAKLDSVAKLAQQNSGVISINSFEVAGANRISNALAQKRASAITTYVKSKGASNVKTGITRGFTVTQSKASLVVFTPRDIGTQIASEKIDSLIVRYKLGVKPSQKTPISGAEKVVAVPQNELSLGNYLGFRMYQINFGSPVTRSVALQVAAQMGKSRLVEFAEPNEVVSIQVAAN
jgi:hypothetical protein